nr:hypothetical protein [Rhizobium sp. ACO-34A]
MRSTAGFLTLAFITVAAIQPVAAHSQDASSKAAPAWENGKGAPGFSAGLRDSKAKSDSGSRKENGLEDIPLANRLSALEVRIGVRSEQLNAWRDYTSALQALLAPQPPKDDESDPRSKEDKTGQERDPFDRVAKLADRIVTRAEAAERLKIAIATLRTTLTAEQLHALSVTSGEEWLRIPRDAFDEVENKSDKRNHDGGR